MNKKNSNKKLDNTYVLGFIERFNTLREDIEMSDTQFATLAETSGASYSKFFKTKDSDLGLSRFVKMVNNDLLVDWDLNHLLRGGGDPYISNMGNNRIVRLEEKVAHLEEKVSLLIQSNTGKK